PVTTSPARASQRPAGGRHRPPPTAETPEPPTGPQTGVQPPSCRRQGATPAGALRPAPDRRQHHHPMGAKRDPSFLPAPRQRSRSARTRGTTTKERCLEERDRKSVV